MKKILSYMSLAITGLLMAACSEDFKDWIEQQAYPQEDAITIPGFTATSTGAIDLSTVDDSTPLITLSQEALPEGYTVQSIRMEVAPVDGDGETTELTADASGNFTKADLQALVEKAYGKRPVSRQFNAHVYASAVKDGQAALIDAGTLTLTLTPEAPQISENYYIVGGPNDWAGSAADRSIKFSHSDLDVYEDPIFTVIFDATEGDTWFAIGDDAACDAIGNGDWSQLFGTTLGNGNSGTTGTLDRRYNLTDEGSFKVDAGAKKIKVTINMMEYSYEVTPVSVADAYYLVGGPLDWAGSAASKEQKFSHSSASVADDPVFTYVLAGTGSEIWFAIGDDEACDAIGNGDWSKLYGTTAGNGNNGFSGSLARRTSLSDDGSFKVDGTAKYYRIQINMAELTYEITELAFDPYIYFIGATDGWSNAEQKLALTDESGIYTGYLYCADPNGWGNEFKFQRVPGDWGTELNTGTFASGISGDFEGGAEAGSNIKAVAGEGVYFVTLDMANLTLNAVRVEKMGIIGDFNGWGGDVDMTWNAADYCFEATNPGVNAKGWKFRVNADWGINLGGTSLDNLVANGDNLSAVGNTIKLYPTRRTSDNIFCTVE